MSTLDNRKRILALDVRPRSFGYVVFEGPDRLLDWGVKSFRNGVNAVQVPRGRKLEWLQEDYLPSVIVLKEPGPRSKRRQFVETVQAKAKSLGIAIRQLRPSAVQKAFGGAGQLTKYAMACALAERFPELRWALPPKRKPWQSEDYRTSIFDAVALGVAYFARQTKQAPEPSSGDPAPP
ncbi:MAG: hypothetical protein L0312_00195 [Acidobacteria bacterium]|nr:hypothetical protein [Acidobacteriota bacterium]